MLLSATFAIRCATPPQLELSFGIAEYKEQFNCLSGYLTKDWKTSAIVPVICSSFMLLGQ